MIARRNTRNFFGRKSIRLRLSVLFCKFMKKNSKEGRINILNCMRTTMEMGVDNPERRVGGQC